MKLKIKGWIISIEKLLEDKPIQEEYFDNPCRYCNKPISPEEAYTMARIGEPHCNLAQFPEDKVN